MPLPSNDPVAFRGVPPVGRNKKMALTMTFTQKQVEAMFARQAALKEQGSSQCPLEIDFGDNKIYIGDITTPFTAVKEDGSREICQRSPTVSKPLAGITLSGNVVGKLNIHRDYDQVAGNIRKLSEAEESKRNERKIVRLDAPPVMTKGKKAKSGSGTSALAKQAMSNRIVSAQAASSRQTPISSPASRPSTPTASSSTTARPTPPSSSRPGPPSSSRTPPGSARRTPPGSSARPPPGSSSATPTPGSSSPKGPDLTSLRARLTHYLALEARTTQQVLLEIGGRSPSPEIVREIEDNLTAVAEETHKDGGPVTWQLRPRSWEQVRPYEFPSSSLTTEQRKEMARQGRLKLYRLPTDDPLLDHFRAGDASDVNGASSSSTKGKGKAKITSARPMLKTSDFKGGMFPKEKKASTKGGGVASGGVTKKAPATKPKVKKDVEDEVEAKARKVVAGLAADAKAKGKAPATAAVASSESAARSPKLKKPEEDEAPPPSTKVRPSLGTVKKEPSPLPPKPRRAQEQGSTSKRKLADTSTEVGSEFEEGELPDTPEAKKRKVTGEVAKPRVPSKQTERNVATTSKAGKERDKINVKDESAPPRQVKEGSAAPKANATSSKAASSTSKALRLEREREREREERELERLKEREREKRRSSGKRARRATPSFSSDEEEEEEGKRPPAPSRTTKPKQTLQPPASSKSAVPPPRSTPVVPARAPAPSPALPTDREALRRRYNTCYARYMGVYSKFHEQRAKVEDALLAADVEGMSVDEDQDMMDSEQLLQLRGEHERLRDELERITHAHAKVF